MSCSGKAVLSLLFVTVLVCEGSPSIIREGHDRRTHEKVWSSLLALNISIIQAFLALVSSLAHQTVLDL